MMRGIFKFTRAEERNGSTPPLMLEKNETELSLVCSDQKASSKENVWCIIDAITSERRQMMICCVCMCV